MFAIRCQMVSIDYFMVNNEEFQTNNSMLYVYFSNDLDCKCQAAPDENILTVFGVNLLHSFFLYFYYEHKLIWHLNACVLKDSNCFTGNS